jgi:hypothetical protein
MADHFCRKVVSGIAKMTGRAHSSYMPWSGHLPVNLTAPIRSVAPIHWEPW